jgi:uncharacterized protein
MRALKELSVLSPLRLCGLTKAEIRRRSREAGLFTWDKPAYACLATRIPSGEKITGRILQRTEAAETSLHELGFQDLRVRHRGEDAFLEVSEKEKNLLFEKWDQIEDLLKKSGYRDAFVNMIWRNPG